MKKTLLVVFFLVYCGFQRQVFAVQTNVNEVTDLFDRHIEDKDALIQNMQQQNDSAIDQIGNQIKSGEHHGYIEEMDASEGKALELNSIKETDLESSGREKRNSAEYQFYDENELEPDYAKPGNSAHKIDADEIVEATEKTMRDLGADLMKRLVALGFNCKTVKGPVQKEPVYHIEIKREAERNIEYDQFFCEEPRNQYNCNDTLTIKCSKTGLRYGPWQDREIALGGAMLYNNYTNWGWSVKLEHKYHVWYIHNNHPRRGTESNLNAQQINDQLRQFIASNLGAGIDQIYEIIGFPEGGRGIGNITPLYSRWRQAWDNYVFKYKYRDTYPICEAWTEDWTERCTLK